RRPMRPMRPSRRLPLAIAGAALAAAVIVAGTLLALGGTGAGPGGGLRPGSVVSSAYLLAKMTAAPQASSDVTHVRVTLGGGRSEDIWRLGNIRPPRTVYRFDGRTCYDIAQTATQVTVVDYVNRTWWVQPVPKGNMLIPHFADCRLTSFFPQSLSPLPAAGSLTSLGTWEREFIARGDYIVDGTTVINGEPALSLTTLGTTGGISVHEWVSASTYLPLRETISAPAQHFHAQSNVSYLPPTEANLDQLTVPVPPGFPHHQQTVPVTTSSGP
ncbi:MAG: hypothetical protein ACRDOI_42950, partial [Trebonia sp.]